MNQYITGIKHENGAILSIGAYCDVMDNRVFRIYYNGSDIGKRYAKIGNASRYIKDVAKIWCSDRYTYGTPDTIPVRGTAWNIALYKHEYCNAPFPTYNEYGH